MAPLANLSGTDASIKFSLLTDKLLSFTHSRVNDKKAIDSCLTELNSLDYRSILIENNNAVMLLVNQLCINIQSWESTSVKNYSQFIVNLMRVGAILKGRTFSACEKWLLEALEYSELETRKDVLAALQSLLSTASFDSINQSLRQLLGEKELLKRLANSQGDELCERNVLAVSCLEAILVSKENSSATIPTEYRRIMKEIGIGTLSSLSYDRDDKLLYNKMVCCCLRILCKLVVDKSMMVDDPDSIGEILGVVKAFLFHGMKGYSPITPQCLRPAAMNLPEPVHIPPRGRNSRSKGKPKRQTPKKSTPEDKSNNQFPLESLVGACKYSSDSETESFNSAQTESKVRLESIRLLHAATLEISSREMFGYWPQIVASGSRDSARVLTRSILKEPVSKVRQCVLSTLFKMLVSAKHFLVHADDAEQPSFLTIFGTVGAIIRELHSTLSLVLSYERNVPVVTHALKCAAGLVQGTPYARLKSGLATKLSRNCRPHMLHKDPTVRVSALSVFEALASLDTLTPEILDILGKKSRILFDTNIPQLDLSATSGADDEEHEEEDLAKFADLSYHESEIESEADDGPLRDKGVCSLLQICLKNITNETERGPVRLQALKLLGALAFNVDSIIFAHLGMVTAALATAAQETEVQVARHACRVIETIAGRLANSCPDDISIVAFWNVIFLPVTSLVQHTQATLREVACDCLGNIGSTMFSQLTRERSILIITILFGAVRDESSAVRAAAVRALGMLVTLPSLEEDTGFLMDLADIVCIAIDDQNLGVRVKAAWALANLCDCLIRQTEDEQAEPIPLEILLPRLYETSVKAAEDNCKVKCNVMRAVGSVIRLSSDRPVLKDSFQGLQVLIKCATLENDMKVRWNACRALGFVISYKPDAILPSSWRDQVFPTLCSLVCLSPNFKVRTNAAWALSVCESYGKYVPSLWKSIVVGLENSQHVPSFVEYPHRDALVQQLCLTLSHLASRTQASDLQSVWEEISQHLDDIASHMKHLHNRVLPEKAGDVDAARTHLLKLNQTAPRSEDRLVAKSLADLFQRTNLYDDVVLNAE